MLTVSEVWQACDTKTSCVCWGPMEISSLYIFGRPWHYWGRRGGGSTWDRKGQSWLTMIILSIRVWAMITTTTYCLHLQVLPSMQQGPQVPKQCPRRPGSINRLTTPPPPDPRLPALNFLPWDDWPWLGHPWLQPQLLRGHLPPLAGALPGPRPVTALSPAKPRSSLMLSTLTDQKVNKHTH